LGRKENGRKEFKTEIPRRALEERDDSGFGKSGRSYEETVGERGGGKEAKVRTRCEAVDLR
jgi:hypothetical protein